MQRKPFPEHRSRQAAITRVSAHTKQNSQGLELTNFQRGRDTKHTPLIEVSLVCSQPDLKPTSNERTHPPPSVTPGGDPEFRPQRETHPQEPPPRQGGYLTPLNTTIGSIDRRFNHYMLCSVQFMAMDEVVNGRPAICHKFQRGADKWKRLRTSDAGARPRD